MSSLTEALVRLRATRDPYAFAYCAADASGAPVLLVAPERVDPRALLKLRTTAQDGALVRGQVRYSQKRGCFVFRPSTAVHPQFDAHLRLVFPRTFPGLHGAEIQVPTDGQEG